MSAAERLTAALQHVEEVLDSLNEHVAICNTCGHLQYQDRDEFQAARSLRGIAEKLKRMAGQSWAGGEER